jgi:hypothetical protein
MTAALPHAEVAEIDEAGTTPQQFAAGGAAFGLPTVASLTFHT